MPEWQSHDLKSSQAGLNGIHEELYSPTAVLPPGQVPPEQGEVLLVDVADGRVLGVMEYHQQQHQDEHRWVS